MADQAKPRISNVTKFFIPGLAIGLLIGGVGGAYFGPRLDGPSMQEIKPKTSGPAPTTRTTGRPEDAPESPKAPAPTGASGPSAATGSTEPSPK